MRYNFFKLSLKVLFWSFVVLMASSCSIFSPRVQTYSLYSRDFNVCKTLHGKVLVYAMFVETETTAPWSRYDIESTIDSITYGMDWLMNKAGENKVQLEYQLVVHKGNDQIIPIYCDISGGSLIKETKYYSTEESLAMDLWADSIAAMVGKSFQKDDTPMIRTINPLKNREHLVAKLRDIYRCENVALLYFVNDHNNYESGVTMSNFESAESEFSVIGNKYPTMIVHELLHLFGARDFYNSGWDYRRRRRNNEWHMKTYPNEIMSFAFRPLHKLDIGPFNRYAIGWANSLGKEETKRFLYSQKPHSY